MKNKYFLSFIVIFTLVFPVFSQNSSVSGYVSDLDSRENLVGATVILNPDNRTTVTNKKGYFNFEKLKAGKYKIRISFMGYSTIERNINLKSNENLKLNFDMQANQMDLPPVIVEDKLTKSLPYVQSKIKRINIETSAARDVGDYLRTVPNVSGIRKGGSSLDPVVRGFKFDQLNVKLDDAIKIEGGCPNRMDPTTAHVEIDDIEEIKIIKGPYTLRYGATSGGMINIISQKPKPTNSEKFTTNIKFIKGYESNWNGNKENLRITGGNNKIYFSLVGGRQKYGNYKDGNNKKILSKFEKYSYAVECGFSPMKNHEIILSHKGVFGKNISYPTLPMDERSDDTYINSIKYQAKNINETIKTIKIIGYNTDVDHKMDNKDRGSSDTLAVAISQIKASTIGGKIETGLNIINEGILYIGTDYEIIHKNGDRTKHFLNMQPKNGKIPTKIENIWDKAKITNLGIFSELRKKIQNIDFTAAIRLDVNKGYTPKMIVYDMSGKNIQKKFDNLNSDFINISASLGINYDINENLNIGLAIGRGVRNPNMIERYIKLLPIGYDKFDYLGDPMLKPEANHQIDLTCRYKKENIGDFNLNIFYSYITDYISSKELPPSQIKPNTAKIKGVKQFINTDYAQLKGAEFIYTTPTKYKIGGQIMAALTLGTIGTSYYKLDVLENDNLNEIPPFETKINIFYKMLNKTLIPKLSARFVAKQDKLSTAFEEENTKGFNIFDFSINYKYNQNVKVAVGVQNIFDKAYYEHLNRRIIGKKGNLYEPGRSFFVNLIINL